MAMPTPTNNIEPVARAICERKLRRICTTEAELEVDVDVERYWHCVAAQIEAGLIDDAGEPIQHDFERGVDAYFDWRARHPDFTPPAWQPRE